MTAAAAPGSQGRILALDGLRGLAALSVVYWHYVPSIADAAPGSLLAYLAKAGGLAWSGVDLFFVLSGFFIGGILMRNRESPYLARVFYFRRACRILPLFLVAFAFYLLVAATWPAGASYERLVSSSIPEWTYLPFIQNWCMAAADDFGSPLLAVTWSLAVEEQFYLIAPLAFWLLPRRWLPWALLGLIAIVPTIRCSVGSMAGFALLPCRADALAIGCLLAWLVENGGLDWLRARPRLIAGTLGAVAIAALIYTKYAHGMRSVAFGLGRLHHSWLAVGYAMLVAAVLTWPESRLARACRWRPLVIAGTLSYGIYLFHGPVLHVGFEFLYDGVPRISHITDLWFPCLLGLATWLICHVLHVTVERPCIRIGQCASYARANPPSTDARHQTA